jgi:CheY-like chemotaxis protein
VRADPGQLEQVVLNLAVNARDAMPRGGTLTLETANAVLDESRSQKQRDDVRPGQYVMLAVSDTGEGMDAETARRAFEPFFTTKKEGRGTGLGLSTVYGIVRQSGGSITVESQPGRGTTFRVFLPRDEASADPEPRPEVRLAPSTSGQTVLVAEDSDGVRLLIRQVLEGAGYGVLEARSGEEALSVAARHPGTIDLLVTDVVMPGMGGREMADRLAAERPGLRSLFMSGYTEDAILAQGVLQASIDFIEKPFTPSALLRKVRQVLDRAARAG